MQTIILITLASSLKVKRKLGQKWEESKNSFGLELTSEMESQYLSIHFFIYSTNFWKVYHYQTEASTIWFIQHWFLLKKLIFLF